MRWRGAALAAAAVLALPPFGSVLSATMPRRMLVQIPALLLAGAVAGWPRRGADRSWHGGDLAALAFGAGAILFWMIPRSLDLAARSHLAGGMLSLSMVAAGCALGRSLHVLPLAVLMALGVHASAMALAMGLVYLNSRGLLCTAYTIDQQRLTGTGLVRGAPFALILLWGWGLRRVSAPGSPAAWPVPPTPADEPAV